MFDWPKTQQQIKNAPIVWINLLLIILFPGLFFRQKNKFI